MAELGSVVVVSRPRRRGETPRVRSDGTFSNRPNVQRGGRDSRHAGILTRWHDPRNSSGRGASGRRSGPPDDGRATVGRRQKASPVTRMHCPECFAVLGIGYAHCPNDGHELARCDDEDLIGTTIAGSYVLDELVGEGGMGLVFRAHHVRLRRTFAVKLLFGELGADSTMRIRFAHEAAAASQLGHPNVVAVVDFGRTPEGLSYLVMEYVDGEPLSEVIEREAPLSPTRTIQIASEIAQGLGHVHSKGLVHRDLKPENILLESRGDGPPRPRILDFGLATSAFPSRDEPRITEHGYVVGTPTYIAPEQVRDTRVDHRADLYALGVVMYEMLAGKPPFQGESADVALRNMLAPIPPVAAINPDVSVPPRLEAIVVRLLQKDPDARYQSASALLAALDTAATHIAETAGGPSIAAFLLRERLPWWWARLRLRATVAARSATRTRALLAVNTVATSRSEGVRWSSLAGACALAAFVVAGTRNPARVADGPVAAIAPPHMKQSGQMTTAPEIMRPLLPATADTPTRSRGRRDGRLASLHIASGSAKVSVRHDVSRLRSATRRSSGPASTRALVRQYHQVGEAIGRLEIGGGGRAVRDLRERYFRLRYSTALRDASVRRETLAALASLHREVQRASKRSLPLTAAVER